MIKNILIDLRDFTYHFSKKQSGEKSVETEYVFKMIGALFLYYFGIIVAATIFIRHYFSLQKNPDLTILMRLFIGVFIFAIPILVFVLFILNRIKNIPIPDTLTKAEYNRKKTVSIIVFFLGLLFFILSFIVPTYLIGGKIDL